MCFFISIRRVSEVSAVDAEGRGARGLSLEDPLLSGGMQMMQWNLFHSYMHMDRMKILVLI